MRPRATRSVREWSSARDSVPSRGASFFAVRIPRSPLGWGWIVLGLAGSLAATVAGADLLRGKAITWWFDPRLPARELFFFGGMAGLCAAWLAIARRLGAGSTR